MSLSNQLQIENNIREGMDVLALFHGDGRVHRAKLQALGEIYAKVKFVDFGNSDDVTYDCIFQYDPTLFPYPDLVIFCQSNPTKSVMQLADPLLFRHLKLLLMDLILVS